ncbi:unnamed protein product [Effrenium voratum]|nr:unnamed protein product [Effrenium voratum]
MADFFVGALQPRGGGAQVAQTPGLPCADAAPTNARLHLMLTDQSFLVTPLSSGVASSQHNDLATEQMRVNAQLASALDCLAQGNRAAKHPFFRDHESEDIASALGKASIPSFQNDWFPSNHLLAKLQKVLSKARESRKNQDHPFIADTSLEPWVPMWVGHGESPSAREALVKQRRKTENLGAQVLEPCRQFLAGQFPDVFAHLLMLIRMSAEHGLSYALHYETKSHYGLQSLTHSSKKFNFSDLLHQPLWRLTHKLDIKHYRSKGRKHDDFTMLAGDTRDAKRPHVTSSEAKEARSAPISAASLLWPGQGLTCADRATCKLHHLDTTDPEQARRHAAALKAMRPKKTCLLGLERRRGPG